MFSAELKSTATLTHPKSSGGSLLKSSVAKAKKAKDHVEEGLEKVRAKPWATPLGKALQVKNYSKPFYAFNFYPKPFKQIR